MMLESRKVLVWLFSLAVVYGFLLGFGYLPEMFIGKYGLVAPVCAASWLGAHARDYDFENGISFRHVVMLLIFPIALGYYFYTNFSFSKASIKFLQSWLVLFLLVAVAELPNIFINGLQTT